MNEPFCFSAPITAAWIAWLFCSLALCALGTWEEAAADNDEWRWCQIDEGWAMTANGGKASLDGMNGGW